MNREELAWAAGLYDGEGSTMVRTTTRAPRLYMAISQSTDPFVLHRFHEAVGLGRISGPYDYKDARAPFWRWSVDSFQTVQACIAMLWPFLSPIKRRQASDVIQKFNRVRTERGMYAPHLFCRKGHPRSTENTYMWHGIHFCRVCAKEWKRKKAEQSCS